MQTVAHLVTSKRNLITASPEETLEQAYEKMREYAISQLPVMQEGHILGLVNETDLLLAVTGNAEGFALPVEQAMTRNLFTLDASQPIEALLPIFEEGMVAIVMDKGEFAGLVTPMDWLEYLRRQA